MGLMSSITGNAAEMTVEQAQAQLQPILLPDETVQRAYQVGRDAFAFTERRLILVDKQGVTGTKVEYRSIPYRAISSFSVETAGNFDLDAELKIHVQGNPLPISKEFNKKVNIYEVQSVLAHYVLR